MRLEDVTAGSDITLYINIVGNKQLSFPSRITEIVPKKHLVLAEAVVKDGKVLSFKGKQISVDVIVEMPDDKPLLFQNVTVETRRAEENGYCYNLIASKEGIVFNRRKNYRCFVGNASMLRTGMDFKEYEVIIRDVSANGFAVTCDSGLNLPNNQLVHVLLEDHIEEIQEEFSFHLYGFVVRKQELEHGKTVYGCRLNNHVGGLESYLNKKERIRIKRNRG